MVPSEGSTTFFSRRNDSSTAFLTHWLTTQLPVALSATRMVPASRPASTCETASRSSALPFDGLMLARSSQAWSMICWSCWVMIASLGLLRQVFAELDNALRGFQAFLRFGDQRHADAVA